MKKMVTIDAQEAVGAVRKVLNAEDIPKEVFDQAFSRTGTGHWIWKSMASLLNKKGYIPQDLNEIREAVELIMTS